MPTPTLFQARELDGIYAKLERADESIKNLNSEISAFLKIPKGTISKNKHKAFAQFTDNARKPVPVRFGVLAGEIVHHLRSCLDHVMWTLSAESYRQSSETAIAFPIFTVKPRSKQEIAGYERKVQGVSDVGVLQLVEQLQPYNAPNPLDEPLAILHELDRVDKHHTLVFIMRRWESSLKIPLWEFNPIVIGNDFKQVPRPPIPATNQKIEMSFSQYIAFGKFGQRESEAVIPGLTQLANTTRDIVELFIEL